ncbi:MAG: helix-turn-helix domain-containing protein [Halodesulfurarchaeum sp.]|nr:helix-turn-helix domain-containing protein [Halodesulfurarchaeum sp.]
MITANLKIRFEGDWVDQLADYDVVGEAITSTYRDNRTVSINALDAASGSFDSVIETIQENKFVDTVEILERYEKQDRIFSTVKVNSEYPTYTPMETMRYFGFLPIGHAKYRDGFEYVEILAENREDLSHLVSLLEYETVEVIRVVSEIRPSLRLSLLEWQQIFESIPATEKAFLELAIESGYMDSPRWISLEDLASEAGIAKSTASRYLRNIEQAVIPMLVKYIHIFS